MALSTYEKKYVERFAEFLATNPEMFRLMAERYQDRRYNLNRPEQLRDFIEARYESSNFPLFDHLPDTATGEYVFAVFARTYEIMGDRKKPIADMAFAWVAHAGVNTSWVAGQMGLTPQAFDKKLKEIGANRFSIEEIVKLAQVREKLINDLRPQAGSIDGTLS